MALCTDMKKEHSRSAKLTSDLGSRTNALNERSHTCHGRSLLVDFGRLSVSASQFERILLALIKTINGFSMCTEWVYEIDVSQELYWRVTEVKKAQP